MKTKLLGHTGLKVSDLCLGTMTFGRDTEESEAAKIMDRFFDLGGNFFDTANIYNSGKSEEILGNWIAGRDRESLVIATKVRFPVSENPNSAGLTRKHILWSVEQSLSRLKTPYIDILQVHAWDPLTPLEETMSTLDSLVRSGKVRYIGASNFRAWQLALSLAVSRSHGWEEFVSLQPQYNLLTRATEYELMPLCEHERIAVLPWSPLKGGLLSGKYDFGGSIPENTRYSNLIRRGGTPPWVTNEEYYRQVISELKNVASRNGKTPSQVALNWLMLQKAVTSPIIGVRNMQQLEEDIGAIGWRLSDDDIARLTRISSIYVTYPYDEWSENQQKAGRVS
ncbi:aldo/keto reductase [Thermoplasmatales archaeon AK]|nr:aldo/keto reductase [Thermoplasmatales archaeon AK]